MSTSKYWKFFSLPGDLKSGFHNNTKQVELHIVKFIFLTNEIMLFKNAYATYVLQYLGSFI